MNNVDLKKRNYDVFISYRRATGTNDARLLEQALKVRGFNVFFDYDSLRNGKFDEHIYKAIEDAPVFILIMTTGCLDDCINEGDWVRLEIEHALKNGKIIIPIAPSDQTWAFPSNMPPSMKELKMIHVSCLDKTALFDASIEIIIENRFPSELKRKTKKIANNPSTKGNSNFVDIKNKLTDLAFQYDDFMEKSSDESLPIEERKRSFMNSIKTINKIIQLYKNSRSLLPENIRSVLDKKLKQCEEKNKDSFLKVIVFVQSFNKEVDKLL